MYNNALISAAVGYDLDDLRPFLSSALHHLPNCEIILLRSHDDHKKDLGLENISDRISTEVIDSYIFDNIISSNIYLNRHHIIKLLNKLGFLLENRLHIRFKRYHSYMRIMQSVSAEKVILCDSRDVVFQDNPFPSIDGTVIAGLEEVKFGSSDILKRWMSDIYGDEILKKVYDKYVICSGVLLGKKDETELLVEHILDEISQLGSIHHRSCGDQALLNKLVYVDDIDIKTTTNREGNILTIGSKTPNSLTVDFDKGKILCNDMPSSILHQYDRYEKIKKFIRNKWSKKMEW